MIDACRDAFHARGEGGRFLFFNILLVLPMCGGRAVIFAEIAKRLVANGTKVLILAHSRELIRQPSAKLRAASGAHGIIAPTFHLTDDRVQVASVQTLASRADKECAQGFGLIMPDEKKRRGLADWLQAVANISTQDHNATHLSATKACAACTSLRSVDIREPVRRTTGA